MIDPTKQPGIRIAQIFLERAMFEHRPDFLEFDPATPVETDIELQLSSGLSPDAAKGRIQILVSSKEEAEPLYRFSFLMTALVESEQDANFPLSEYVKSHALGMMFPFVRELVANVTSRGRFGPLWLRPVNLVALTAVAPTAPAQLPPADAEGTI
jgi:preprotein translocase subunit SecB